MKSAKPVQSAQTKKVQPAQGKPEPTTPQNKPLGASNPEAQSSAATNKTKDPKAAQSKPDQNNKAQAPAGPKAGPPKPDEGPPPLPKGPSPELEQAYNFLQNYVSKQMQGLNPQLASMPDVPSGSPLDQVGNLLPKTISGSIKNYPNFSQATGSTPSPQVPTGVMPPNLVGGLDRKQVALNQIPLPISKT